MTPARREDRVKRPVALRRTAYRTAVSHLLAPWTSSPSWRIVLVSAALVAACGGSSNGSDASIGTDATIPNAAKDITAFTFLSANNPGLATDVVATIDGTDITPTVRLGSHVTALVATFSTTGVNVSVEGVTQASGTTANDFSNPVTYWVTAADGSTQSYAVHVGATGFAPHVDLAVGIDPTSVVIGDVNGDGKPDLAVTNTGVNTVSILLNTTPTGAAPPTFSAPVNLATGMNPGSLVIADVNGDGKPDLAMVVHGAAPFSTSVSILLNTTATGSATLSFATSVEFALENENASVTAADLDGDGRLDFAVSYFCSSTSKCLSVLLNTTPMGATTPSFSARVDFTTNDRSGTVAIGDLNGDGTPDLVLPYRSTRIGVFANTTATGAIAPSLAPELDVGVQSSGAGGRVLDLNGDGKLDLVIVNGGVSVLLNTTASSATPPSFEAPVDFTTGSGPGSIASDDLDGDGKPDLVTANQFSNTVSVLLNTTAANATTPSFARKLDFPTGASPVSIAIGDFNGDGRPDVVTANAGQQGSTTNTLSILVAR